MDRNVERAFGLSVSVIIYGLYLAAISVMFTFAYSYFDAKVKSEHANTSLVKVQSDYLQEDEDFILYTGRTEYDTSYGDDIDSSVLAGNNRVVVSKSDDWQYTKSGEAVTGASVFTEIMHLPASVQRVTIDGHILYNDTEHYEDDSSHDHPNIAYYTWTGLSEGLLEKADIDLTDVYRKSYEYDGTYGYITEIVYTKYSSSGI